MRSDTAKRQFCTWLLVIGFCYWYLIELDLQIPNFVFNFRVENVQMIFQFLNFKIGVTFFSGNLIQSFAAFCLDRSVCLVEVARNFEASLDVRPESNLRRGRLFQLASHEALKPIFVEFDYV